MICSGWFFIVPDSDPGSDPDPDTDPIHIIYASLEINKTHLKMIKSIKKKNLPNICNFLFHSTVLQYTQSRIHRPKIKNKIFIYLFFHFLLDPEQQFCIRIRNAGLITPGWMGNAYSTIRLLWAQHFLPWWGKCAWEMQGRGAENFLYLCKLNNKKLDYLHRPWKFERKFQTVHYPSVSFKFLSTQI